MLLLIKSITRKIMISATSSGSPSGPLQYNMTLKGNRTVMVQNIFGLESWGRIPELYRRVLEFSNILNILPRICAWMSACVCVLSVRVCVFVSCVRVRE